MCSKKRGKKPHSEAVKKGGKKNKNKYANGVLKKGAKNTGDFATPFCFYSSRSKFSTIISLKYTDDNLKGKNYYYRLLRLAYFH